MEKEIVSTENAKIKELVKLRENRRTRYRENCFLLEGVRLSVDALSSEAKLLSLYYTKEAQTRYEKEISRLQSKVSESILVSEEVFRKISDTKNPQGVLMVCQMLDKLEISSKMEKKLSWLVLEKISDPGNMGTIFRSADALGAALLLVGDGVDPYSPKVIRSAMGALFRVPFIMVENAEEAFALLKEKQLSTYAAVPHCEQAQLLSEAIFTGNEAIWIGNEGHGLEETTIKACNQLLTIDMEGHAESLNAAVAASIILWELSKAH